MTQSQVLSPTESPQDETETIVGRLFAEMLGVSGLPRTASFFDLGLDSVAVTIACARLEAVTGVRIRFSQLFRTPTVARLAAWIDGARAESGGAPDVVTTPADARAVELVAITPMQAETVPTAIVVELAWWFDGELDDTALERAATDVHRRHQALHARYLTGPELGLAELPVDPGQAEFHRLGREDTDAAATDALWATLRRPLRLGDGEVWRCATVRSAQSGRLLFGLVVHHAAFDGRSWDIMTEELPIAYAARAAGKAPQWSGRVASLGEMAADFRHQLASADVATQRRYWRDELHEMPACDFPRRPDAPPAPDAGGARWPAPGPAEARSFRVTNAQLEVWEDYARRKGMPPSVGIAAAYVQAVVRSGGSRDFGVMVAIANQASEVIDRTITNRVGNILLRPNGPARSGPNILARAQESYFQAMAARDVLVDPKELGDVLSGEDSDGVIHLDRLASLTYNTVPLLDLGGVAGTIANGEDAEDGDAKCMFALMLLVVPLPEGLAVDVIVRTDLYEPGLAERLGRNFMDIIDQGPLRLELETEPGRVE
jgi:aryl carrier-like protein